MTDEVVGAVEAYEKPKVVDYGDLMELTASVHPFQHKKHKRKHKKHKHHEHHKHHGGGQAFS